MVVVVVKLFRLPMAVKEKNRIIKKVEGYRNDLSLQQHSPFTKQLNSKVTEFSVS